MATSLLLQVVALGEALFTLWMLIATDGDYGRVIRTVCCLQHMYFSITNIIYIVQYRVIVIGSFVIDGLSLFLGE